ncbi:DUF5658 family protein [Methanoregula sp.]|jgi:hypothetical protein|uniref:DUF5658 family protein n=1 Tax=Methanoregula sp. TaxID=2052170 RepID=UPI00261436CD|nr:DUF5658 family protein [Methanoregula sp.]MDD5142801.1 DUF5658 family protein [Methanoregula sp.]
MPVEYGLEIQTKLHEVFPRDYKIIRTIAGFLLILGALFLLDIVTTEIILLRGGIELNPLMVGIVEIPALHAAIKMAILFLIFVVSLVAEKYMTRSGTIFCCIIITLYILVVSNNLFVILPWLSG